MTSTPRILIAAEHASARFGGEAALPLHYFRVLRRRGHDVWLLSHARTREELTRLFPGESRIVYVEDTDWHRFLNRAGQHLPDSIAYLTTGFLSRLSTQRAQRRIARGLVRAHGIGVVHQPMPVSPREPSLLHDLGAPVVIGPMNGGMSYPPAFAARQGAWQRLALRSARRATQVLNAMWPGKRRAAALLVANARTRAALPHGIAARVVELPENGVDLDVWSAAAPAPTATRASPVFVYMGRLVDWKAVDIVLEAYARARDAAPMRLWIIGDGQARAHLESTAAALGLVDAGPDADGSAHFTGWLDQATCAEHLARADALVLSSLLECGGAVVLEAMALAKPVIATAWGGPLDYLDPTCGVLVEPHSRAALVDGFAKAMLQLASSPQLRAQLGAAGRAKVRRHYDWEAKVDRMLVLYRELAGTEATSSCEAPGSGVVAPPARS